MRNLAIAVGIVSLLVGLQACGGGDEAISVSLNTPVVNDKRVNLSASFEGSPEEFFWEFGDGADATTTAPSSSHEYAQSGNYTVNVTARKGDKESVASAQVTIEQIEQTATLTATPTSGPAPLTVQFSSTLSGENPAGVTEEYDFGNGIRAGPGASVRHTYQDPGTYQATVTITDNDGQTAAESVTITVGEPAQAAKTWEVRMLATDDGEFIYDPAVLKINPGDTVRWVNVNQAHSATAYSSENNKTSGIPQNGPSWDSSMLLAENESFDYTFPENTPEGSYPYFCLPHEFAGQVGIIIVGSYSELDQTFIDSLQGLARDNMLDNISAAEAMN